MSNELEQAKSIDEAREARERPWTLVQLAAHYQVSRSTIQRLIKKHDFPYFQVGGQLRFYPAQVREFFRAQQARR